MKRPQALHLEDPASLGISLRNPGLKDLTGIPPITALKTTSRNVAKAEEGGSQETGARISGPESTLDSHRAGSSRDQGGGGGS